MRTKPAIVGWAGTSLSGLWGVYAHYTTAAQLPEDATKLAKVLTDPPVYLPWLVLVAFIVFLANLFWRAGRGTAASSRGTVPSTDLGIASDGSGGVEDVDIAMSGGTGVRSSRGGVRRAKIRIGVHDEKESR